MYSKLKMSCCYYSILGIEKKATNQEIKSAYKKLARIYHPDSLLKSSTPNNEKFNEIHTAYYILQDEESRKIYDDTKQSKNTKKNNNNNINIWNEIINTIGQISTILLQIVIDLLIIFNKEKKLFTTLEIFNYLRNNFDSISVKYNISTNILVDLINQLNIKIKEKGKINGPNIEIKLKTKLEDVYTQQIKKYIVRRYRCCLVCDGYNSLIQCQDCNSIFKNTIIICPSCLSWNFNIIKCLSCERTGCKISGCFLEQKLFFIPLFQNKICFKQESDMSIRYKTIGDVIFYIDIKKHDIYELYENHIIYTKTISLYEYLYGINFIHNYLGNQKIRIVRTGQLLNNLYTIKNLGLPPNEIYTIQGDLIIKLNLDTNSIDRELLYKLFPPSSSVPSSGSGGEVIIKTEYLQDNIQSEYERNIVKYIEKKKLIQSMGDASIEIDYIDGI